MKTIAFTEDEMNSLLTVLDYLKNGEAGHFEEGFPLPRENSPSGAENRREFEEKVLQSAGHIYVHALRVQNAVRKGAPA